MTAKQTLVSALGKIGLIFAVAAAFLMAMLSTIYLSLRSPEVRVPEVVNQKRWDAEDALNDSGLNMRVRATRYVAKVQPDMVLTQSPAPGEAVKAGQTIAVVVSRAPGKDDPVVTTSEVPESEETQNQNAALQNQNSNARPARTRAPANANARNSNAAAGARNANSNYNTNRNAIINRNSNVGGANVTNSNRAPRANVNVNRRPAATAPAPPTVPRPNN